MTLLEFMSDSEIIEIEKNWIRKMKDLQLSGSKTHNPLCFLEYRLDKLNSSLSNRIDALEYVNIVYSVSNELVKDTSSINIKNVYWEFSQPRY